MTHMERIGVRELRQNASRYLARVAAGEDFQITDRGTPVALLVPVPANPWDQLLASGSVRAPDDEGDITEVEPVDFGLDASAVLSEIREGKR